MADVKKGKLTQIIGRRSMKQSGLQPKKEKTWL